VEVVPRAHGSALFERGETQILGVTTLNMLRMEQQIDSLGPESRKRYLHHYNFPPYSTGETGRVGSPKRREIGHGALAERALVPVVPSKEEWPYTLRVVSDVLSSNGSTSMGSVCGSTLSLMDAGVPIKAPVAGIAMGLIKEGDAIEVLTDILGVEDHLGDMDFKVCGTRDGITAFQLDTKIGGVPRQVMMNALDRARQGRMHILGIMEATLAQPRTEMSPYAPRILILHIHPDKIREVIGPGGKVIKRIQEETGAQIDIDDSGEVRVAAVSGEGGRRAEEMIRGITEDPEVGRTYQGKVRSVVTFGAFIEIVPGRDGLLHISEIEHHRVGRVEDVLNVGDLVMVKVIGVDREGKIKLSRKALLPEPEGAAAGAGSSGGGDRGDRGDRGERGRDRGRDRDRRR
jgi:polyribonucleotide nucleotidyltransferase